MADAPAPVIVDGPPEKIGTALGAIVVITVYAGIAWMMARAMMIV